MTDVKCPAGFQFLYEELALTGPFFKKITHILFEKKGYGGYEDKRIWQDSKYQLLDALFKHPNLVRCL